MPTEFLEHEAKHLPTHVQNCQRRFEMLDKRMTRIEYAVWAILAAVLLGGGVTIKELLPIARALAGVPG